MPRRGIRLFRRPGGRARRRTLSGLTAGVLLAAGTTAGGVLPAQPATAASAVMLSTPKDLGGWGVTGLDLSTSPLKDWKSNVTALAEWNGRIYVGGMFTTVARNGNAVAAQPYLAAFDRTTGAWVSSFRPKLDGGVWDLVVTPGGRLIVGGYFSTVNNRARPALVALDPANGFVDHRFAAVLSRTSGRVGVRTLDRLGSALYVGGNVTRVQTGSTVVHGKNLFRLSTTTGRPATAFHPTLSTAPWDVWASRAGDRVYAAGRFGTVNGAKREVLAVLRPSDGALVPGLKAVRPTFDCRPSCASATYGPYSLAVRETADRTRVLVTPTEHGLQSLTRGTLTPKAGRITAAAPTGGPGGGDFQALAQTGGVLYAACHCWGVDYKNAFTTKHPNGPPVSYSGYSKVSGIAAYDPLTLGRYGTFRPTAYGQYGDGAWELLVDSTGCLWAGGDYTRTGDGRWLGGFAKFCRT